MCQCADRFGDLKICRFEDYHCPDKKERVTQIFMIVMIGPDFYDGLTLITERFL
jgi:hypothetical protein